MHVCGHRCIRDALIKTGISLRAMEALRHEGADMDIKAWEALLGIKAPWHVAGIDVNIESKEVVVRVECEPTEWCNTQRRLHVHAWEKRRWRHLDLWQCRTIIEAQVPRLLNPATGTTEMAAVPWAEGLSRWTKLFEARAIDVLLSTRSISDASRLLRLGWEPCDNIMRCAVDRGMQRRPVEPLTKVGIDEKSFHKGQSYISVMTDLLGARVLEVVQGAGQKEVQQLWQTLPEEQRNEVQAAAMDRGRSMIAGTRAAAPQAAIVHDHYHISAEQNKAVDIVRRAECKKLMSEGDDTLKGTRYTWLTGLANLGAAAFASFKTLVQLNLKTSRAWELKTTFESFWGQADKSTGLAFFKKWKNRAVRSRLAPFVKLAKSLEKSLPELLNYFEHRISNAMSEGFNSIIQQLRASARGFNSFANYRTRILFFCGKLDMKPAL
jgi:transposase